MTDLQKEQILQAIKDEVSRLGSQNKVATKCEVSSATISQMLNHNWELIKAELWQKVAQALDINTTEQWQITETTNYRMVFSVLSDAKNASLFIPISHKAGSGKTTALTTFANLYAGSNVFYIQAREWARREFLVELCKVLGIKQDSGYTTVDVLGQKVIQFFAQLIHHLETIAVVCKFNFVNPFGKVGKIQCFKNDLFKFIRRAIQFKKFLFVDNGINISVFKQFYIRIGYFGFFQASYRLN